MSNFMDSVYSYFQGKESVAPSYSNLVKAESDVFLDEKKLAEGQKIKVSIPAFKLNPIGSINFNANGIFVPPFVEEGELKEGGEEEVGEEKKKKSPFGYNFFHKVKILGAECSETWTPEKVSGKIAYKHDFAEWNSKFNGEVTAERSAGGEKGIGFGTKLSMMHPYLTGEFAYNRMKDTYGFGITHSFTKAIAAGASLSIEKGVVNGGFGAKYTNEDYDFNVFSELYFKKEKEKRKMIWKTMVQKKLDENQRIVGKVDFNISDRKPKFTAGYEKKFASGSKMIANVDQKLNVLMKYDMKVNEEVKVSICSKSDIPNNKHKFGVEISSDFGK